MFIGIRGKSLFLRRSALYRIKLAIGIFLLQLLTSPQSNVIVKSNCKHLDFRESFEILTVGIVLNEHAIILQIKFTSSITDVCLAT